MRHLTLEIGDDGIAVLTLDNADERMNVISEAWMTEMHGAVDQLKADDRVRGVILTSAKPSFMAGADLKMLVEGYETMDRPAVYAFSQRATHLHRALETMGKPVAAALNGLALGGGYELALACHYRVLSSDRGAVVGLPEVKLGLLPASGGTQRLPRIAGVKTALDILLSGRSVAPAEALKLGLVDALAEPGEEVKAARAWLAGSPVAEQPWDVKGFKTPESRGMVLPEVAAGYTAATAKLAASAGYNLPAPAAILSCVFEGLQLPFDRALSVESKYFARLLTDPVARNIIRTTFISRQAAEKGARRPAGIEKSVVRKVGVLGAGMMGAGIALVSAQAGIDVVLIDRDIPAAEKGKAYSARVLGKRVEKGEISQQAADAILARLLPTDDYSHLQGADLIIEAVFEDVAIKADVTARAEAVIPPGAIFGSNTSTLPITRLAAASSRSDQFIGLHFFSPVERMGLVEVIMGRETSPATLAKSLDFIRQLRKTPIVVNDSRGFYTSRVFQRLVYEGTAMLSDGVEPARIENAARAAGYPVGPLTLLDEVTIDLPLKVMEQALEIEGAAVEVPAGTDGLYKMRDLGRTSRKAGGAFYEYPEGSQKHLWPGLAEAFPPAAEQPEQDELKARFLYAQAMETARCLEEGVLETPEDADLGAVYGWGFPAWTGGTISYIDTIGIEKFVREADRLAQLYGPRFAPSAWLRDKAARNERFYPRTGQANPS